MVSGICQVHALKNLQVVRLRWYDANRTGELNVTFHANLKSIIPQRCQASRVLIVVMTLASLTLDKSFFFKCLFVPHFSPPVQWGTFITKIINRSVNKCHTLGG